jgi:predicted DCC family thiol-disulfide oxidoreductase YuxK
MTAPEPRSTGRPTGGAGTAAPRSALTSVSETPFPGDGKRVATVRRFNGVIGFFERRYSLDLRALSLFRICLGALILGDLVWRARDLRTFYTDFGVLPRAAFLERFADPWIISVHLMSGTALVQALLFLVAAVFGLMLLAGYRTRLAAVASWALLISLQNRNPILLQGGDVLLRMLVFWAMFLPLNAYFSVDRALDNSEASPPQRVCTVGTLALMAQVAMLYWFSAWLKQSPEWGIEGSAVYYALSLEQFATSVGRYLLQFPHLLRSLTYLTLAIEVAAPLLLFSPFWSGQARLAAILLIALLQLGLAVCMHLGHFPLVALVALIPLVPTWLWVRRDRPGDERQTGARRPLTIYYDGGCDFCRKLVLMLKAFALAPDTVIARAQDDPQALAEMTREHSWVVVDRDGRHYFRTSALAAALRTSIFKPLAWTLERAPIRALGDRVYRWVANHRSLLARLVSPLTFRSLQLRTGWIAALLAAFFLVYVCWWNLGTVSSHLAMPARYRWIGVATRTDQIWDMFAPYPLRDDGWYVIDGVLHDGRHVDVFRGGAPVSFAKPNPAQVAAQYRDERWRKYLMNLYLRVNSDYRLYYGKYLCRSWNERRTVDDPQFLETFEIFFMMRTTALWTEPPREYKKISLHSHRCR